jgi:hypothetical protein
MMDYILEGVFESLVTGLARDLAELVVYSQPATVGPHLRDADRRCDRYAALRRR